VSSIMDKLRERIEDNYDELREEMLSRDNETIFDSAMSIAAATDVLFYMSTHDWVDEDEAAYLLDFSNPLVMLAEAWEEHLNSGDGKFRSVLESVLECEDNEENYMTMAMESELREKHGYNVTITEAVLIELVEAGNRLAELRAIYEGLGADVCDEE
jgi:hypothetical protein